MSDKAKITIEFFIDRRAVKTVVMVDTDYLPYLVGALDGAMEQCPRDDWKADILNKGSTALSEALQAVLPPLRR
jgi:hypothetical protein